MKLEYRHISPLRYCIVLINVGVFYSTDMMWIAIVLNIDYTELIDIITSNKGFYSDDKYLFQRQGYYFHTPEDADATIEVLIPYLILTTLTE